MGSILIHKEVPPSTATVSGSWSANTASISGILKQVIVVASSTGTYFDFSLTDNNSIEVFSRESVHRALNEIVDIPVTGTYTMTISNATADESFTVKLLVQEKS